MTEETIIQPQKPKQKKKRTFSRLKFYTQIVFSILMTIIVVCGILLWRLGYAPVSLNFLKPYLAPILKEQVFDVDIGNISLHKTQGTFADIFLKLDDLKISDKENDLPFLEIDKTSIKLSIKDLIDGTISPKNLNIKNVTIELFYDKEKGILLGFENFDDDSKKEFEFKALTQIFEPLFTEDSLQKLKKFRIKKFNFTLYNESAKKLFSLNKGSLIAHKNQDGLFLSIEAKNPYLKKKPLFINALYLRKEKRVELSAKINVTTEVINILSKPYLPLFKIQEQDKVIDAVTNLVIQNDLKPIYIDTDIQTDSLNINYDKEKFLLKDFNLKAEYNEDKAKLAFNTFYNDGKIDLKLTSNNTKNFDTLPFILTGTLHNINQNGFWQKPISINIQSIQGVINQKQNNIDFENIALKAENIFIKGNGKINVEQETGQFKAKLDGLTKKDIVTLWPIKLPGTARSWVHENINIIHFKQGIFTTQFDIKKDILKLYLAAPFKNGNVSFLRPMPPATHAYGLLELKDNTFKATIKQAYQEKITLKNAIFFIPEVMADIPIGQVSSEIYGNLQDFLELLDNKPLSLVRKNGFEPKYISGKLEAKAELIIPLLRDLLIEDIGIKGQGKVTELKASLPEQEDFKLTNGSINFDMTQDGMNTKGIVFINDIPANIKWFESFILAKSITRQLDIDMELNLEKIENLIKQSLASISNYMKGTAKVKLSTKFNRYGFKAADLNIDFFNTEFFIDDINYRLKAKTPKILNAVIETKNNIPIAKNIYFKAPDTDIKIDYVELDKNNNVHKILISHLYAKNLIQAKGDYNIVDNQHIFNINADYIDLRSDKKEEKREKELKPYTIRDYKPFTNIKGKADINTLYIDEDTKLNQLQLNVKRNEINNFRIDTKASIKQNDLAYVSYIIDTSNQDTILLDVPNIGNALSQANLYTKFKGGNTHLIAKRIYNNITKLDTIKGYLSIDGGRLYKAPLLARILSLASLQGIIDVLNGNGLLLDKTTVNFKYIDKILHIKNARMRGSALGLTARGFINLNNNIIKVKGALIPFYGLNTLTSPIPILGNIINGNHKEGFWAIGYALNNNINSPKISINPLTIISLGIIREIFK